ncbi:MAG: TetR/AcrR family transcriptional regulator [Anaerolineae bacterium]|nr:TetR/AcrR family transcriptional regulator [Anaerolineae bacterium]
MPYPSRVNEVRLVESAWQMIGTEGSAEQVSLAKLAAAFGVKAPSLYRYFPNKTELVRAVNLLTLTRMNAHLLGALENLTAGAATQRALAMGHAYRAFARQYPAQYRLAYHSNGVQPAIEALEALALPVQQVMAELVGPEKALLALRGAWALLHGFASLEINQAFRRAGDLDAAFEGAWLAYVRGWAANPLG